MQVELSDPRFSGGHLLELEIYFPLVCTPYLATERSGLRAVRVGRTKETSRIIPAKKRIAAASG